jgi:hypothetical protein
MPQVKEQDPRESYSRVLKVLNENQISSIRLSQISVIDSTDGLANILNSAFNGVYVRAAHIYRMNVR